MCEMHIFFYCKFYCSYIGVAVKQRQQNLLIFFYDFVQEPSRANKQKLQIFE